MAKPRSKIADYLVYLGVRTLLCIFQALSLETCCRLADGLAWLLFHVDRRHRLVADDNLRHAFGDHLTPEQRTAVVRAVYQHFCTMMVETLHLSRYLRPTTWKQRLHLLDAPATLGMLLSGRPVMVVSGHLGSWELGSWILGLLGFRVHAIARPLDNPYLDSFVRRMRMRTGQTVLAKKGDFDRMEEHLQHGGILLTLADQDAGRRGLYVDFFGRPASTHKAIALLSLEHNTPLVVMAARRRALSRGRRSSGDRLLYEIRVADVIDPQDYQSQPGAVAAITQRFTTALEQMVRETPEQYFWLHRRWKHQPQAKKSKQVA